MSSRITQFALRPAHVRCCARPRPHALQFRGRQSRWQSSSTSSSTSGSASTSTSGGSSHIVAGLVGGGAVAVLGYTWYHFSGAKTVVNSIHQTKSSFDSIVKKSTESAPRPNEAIQWLRETLQSYAKVIPGSQQYIDTAFDDLEKINQQHGPEVEKIIKDAYGELKEATKAGASFETAAQTWSILQKALSKIGGLAKDASQDILKNHPQLQEKLGGRFDQLQKMSEHYGPEAKKQVEDTWKQVQDIVKEGPLQGDSLKKIQDLVQEKVDQLSKYGEQAWSKGVEEAKPILDKYPQVKEYVEKNKDQLKDANLSDVWQKLKELANEKGADPDEIVKSLQSQVDGAKKKAQSSGVPTSLTSILGQIPGAEEIGDKLHKLHELYDKRGKEAEDLVKSAMEDVKKVLSKKVAEGEKLAEKGKKDVSS